jgi:hypothetical protein
MALALLLAMSLVMVFISSCDDNGDTTDTGTGTPTSSDTPSDTGSPTASDDPEPTPTPPDSGSYLGGSTFFDSECESVFPPVDPNDPLCAAYIVDDPNVTTETTINVTLVIEAGDAVVDEEAIGGTAFREIVNNITLSGSSEEDFRVDKLLVAADGDQGLDFHIPSVGDFSYLGSVTHTDEDGVSTTWTAGQWGYDGWVFRVNDKFPVRTLGGYDDTYYEGTAINQTPLDDGDIVHFFYDYPGIFMYESSTGDLAAEYLKIIKKDYSDNVLTIQLLIHDTFISPSQDMQMQVNNYVALTGMSVNVRLLNSLTGAEVRTVESDEDTGDVKFTGLESGEYIIATDPVLHDIDDILWKESINDAYFDLTGAYSKIIIP